MAPRENRLKVGKSVVSRKARKCLKSRKGSRQATMIQGLSRKAKILIQKIGRQIGGKIKRPSLHACTFWVPVSDCLYYSVGKNAA